MSNFGVDTNDMGVDSMLLDSTMGLTSVSGLGGILVYFIPMYSAEGKSYDEISALLTCTSLVHPILSSQHHLDN